MSSPSAPPQPSAETAEAETVTAATLPPFEASTEAPLTRPTWSAPPVMLKPTKPDYLPLSAARRPEGAATYAGAAAEEDAKKGLLVSDAVHDMTFYTRVSDMLPDAGRPVLNSVLFSHRSVVNDGPSIEEELALVDEKIRMQRASRLQEIIAKHEHDEAQAEIDERVEARIRDRARAERERAFRRIGRILDEMAPDLEKAIKASEVAVAEDLRAVRREMLEKQVKDRKEIQEKVLKDMRLSERRWLVNRQFRLNMEERNALDMQHYFGYREVEIEERQAFRHLYEIFYEGRILVGLVEDEDVVRTRAEGLEVEAWKEIMALLRKRIPEWDTLPRPTNANVGSPTEQVTSAMDPDSASTHHKNGCGKDESPRGKENVDDISCICPVDTVLKREMAIELPVASQQKCEVREAVLSAEPNSPNKSTSSNQEY